MKTRYHTSKGIILGLICVGFLFSACDEKNVVESTEEPLSDFDKVQISVMQSMHEMFLEVQKTQPNLSVTYSLDEDGAIKAFFNPNATHDTHDMQAKIANAQRQAPICGAEPDESGVSFFTCAYNWIKKNPGKCFEMVACARCLYEKPCQ